MQTLEFGFGFAIQLTCIGEAIFSLKVFQRAVLTGVDDKGRALKLAMPHWKDASFQSDKGKAPSKDEVAAIQRYLRTVK